MGRLPSPVESSERTAEESMSLPESGVLFEFRAGKMVLDGTQVRADPRKGVVRIVKTDDALVHFQWCDSVTSIVEDDSIVFPDEAVFEKVPQSSGRVFLLKFKYDNRRFFYWMQGRSPEDDEIICEVVKIHLNQPLDGNEELDEGARPDADWDTREAGGDSSRDVNMTSVSSGVQSSTTDAVQAADLQRILHDLGQVSVPQDSFTNVDEDQFLDTGPSFTDIFKPDLILPFLDQKVLEERLAQYLPEGVSSPEDLVDLIRSPPFQQQLDAFTREHQGRRSIALGPEALLTWPEPFELHALLDQRALASLPKAPNVLSNLPSPEWRFDVPVGGSTLKLTHKPNPLYNSQIAVLLSGQMDWAQFGVDSRNYISTVSSFLEALENQTNVSEMGQAPSAAPQEEEMSEVEHSGGPRDDQRTTNDDDVMEECK